MTVFLQSLGSRVAKAVTKPFSVPVSDDDTWSDIAIKEFDTNAKAHYALLKVLNDDDIARVIHCKYVYEIWSYSVVTYEGTSKVKRVKIDLLYSQYENFIMHEFDTKITNGLASLGDTINNDQKLRKVICALLPSWKVKAMLERRN